MSKHNEPELKSIAIADLRPSKTNPRKVFGEAAMKELADSIRTQGIRQPILARPKPGETPFEIVAGERRWRGAKLAGLEIAPVIVAMMSDREALEIQVVENLQREDLTELEEAESYQSMLDLRENGEACYTIQTLAQRFGISDSKIYQRLNLLKLSDTGRKAMESGQLGARQAVLIGRIPDPAERERALERVLNPKHSTEVLTYRETEELIKEEFMLSLNGAPFKLADATLLPEAGACSTCPMMTDNCRHLFTTEEAAHFKKQKLCTSPGCFRNKLQALWAKRSAKAEEEGMIVLSERQSREIFPAWQTAGEMDWNSEYVLVNEKPNRDLLKPEVVDTVGTWNSLIEAAEKETAAEALEAGRVKIRKDADLDKAEKQAALEQLEKNPPKGMSVPRLLARDQKGIGREIVERKLAIVAIEQAGEPIFQGKVGGRVTAGSDAFAKQRKKELDAAKQRLAESIEGMTQMHAALVASWVPSPVWESIFEIAMGHAATDGLWLVGKWKGLKFGAHNTGKEEAVAKWAMELPANERQALVPLLLIGQQMKWSGLGEAFEQVSQGANLRLDIADIVAKVKGAAKDAKKAAKAPKAKKQSKAEKIAEQAAHYGWNENGVAEKSQISTTGGIEDLPEGVKCNFLAAFAPDGKWRIGVDLVSRLEGKSGMCFKPNLANRGYKDLNAASAAASAEALLFFKHDPAVFKLVAFAADPKDVAEIEGEGGGAPVTSVPVTKDPAILEQWVKAAAGGMPAEEIARSYGVPLADVEGALELSKPAEEPKPKKLRAGEILAGVKQQVVDMTCAGRTAAEIGKDLGISLASIQNIRKEAGLVKARTPAPEPAAATEAPPEAAPIEVVGIVPAAEDERYAGLPESTHTAIDLINAGKTTHEIAAGAGITIADVIRLRQQLEHDRKEDAKGTESAA